MHFSRTIPAKAIPLIGAELKMIEEESRPTVHLSLDVNAVAEPAHIAAFKCREIVDFYFDALAKADLSKRPAVKQNGFFRFDIRGPDLTADSRRDLYERWILAKAFQDLMRGVRASLEQANLFAELISRRYQVKADPTFEDLLSPFIAAAANQKFSQLLRDVNARLQRPLEFAAAYQSLQKARNCLEHRNGIVGKPDVGSAGAMELNFPRIKLFYERHGEEVELAADSAVNASDKRPDVEILMRFDVRFRRFNLGERLVLSIGDFNEIIFACYQFGSQLATRLPKLETAGTPRDSFA
jgi:hypothetical protein